jgi:ribose/xylose/arabinose/galactoside ABC-type transport system permease subunit
MMAASSTQRRAVLSRRINEYGLLVALIALIVLFTALNPRFLTLPNFGTLLEQNTPLLIIAVSMTFAIISRNIDLAPASILALSGVFLALVYTATGSILLGIAVGILSAVLVELFNALIIVRGGINPLIVTLACWIWARGLAVSLTGANSISVRDPLLDFLTRPLIGDFSPAIGLGIVAFFIGVIVLNRTRIGRYTFAMGSDERATIQAGVPVGKYKFLLFGMFGCFVGAAMLVTVSRLGAAAPDAAYGLELDAIVAVIIGGNPFQGGDGSLRRTLIGVLFIAVLNNGLGNLGMMDAQIAVYKGLAIILALVFGALSAKAASR